MARQWYVRVSVDECRGPYTSAQLKDFAVQKKIRPESEVRPGLSGSWVKAGKVKGLFATDTTSSQADSKLVKPNASEPAAERCVGTIPCPSCGVSIEVAAAKCRHCGKVLDAQTAETTRQDSENSTEPPKPINEANRDSAPLPPGRPTASVNDDAVTDGSWPSAEEADSVSDSVFHSVWDSLSLQWAPSKPHLRRCLGKTPHYVFSTHLPCAICSEPTVGLFLNQVITGVDSACQDAYRIWDFQRRIRNISIGVGLVVSAIAFAMSWWFVITVPLILLLTFAVPSLSARILKKGLQNRIDYLTDQHTPLSSAEQGDIARKYIDPFLRRNERPDESSGPVRIRRFDSFDKAGNIVVPPAEIRMLETVLARDGIELWKGNVSPEEVLTTFVLRGEYAMFKRRIEHMEAPELSAFKAYSLLTSRDDAFLPFLLQLQAQRGKAVSDTEFKSQLAIARRELELGGFRKDLEHRRNVHISITIEIVDQMDPFKFEHLLGMIYETRGFRVKETPSTGDQGADVLLEKAGETTVVQAKLYSNPVGNKAVQEAIAAKGHFRCNRAAVVTNNEFTKSACELAASCSVELVSRSQLATMIEYFNRQPKDYARLKSLVDPVTPWSKGQ